MDDLYEIRIRGFLDDRARTRLEAAFRTFEHTETLIRGRISDQAELRALLAGLQDLGCELLEAQRLTPRRRT